MKFIRAYRKRDFSESELLGEYARTGDLELLGRLYESYMPLVYGLCLKYYKDEERSKDAVMHIFEQLVTKLRVHQVRNFKIWLYTLARNECLMDLRVLGKYEHVNVNDHFVEKSDDYHLDLNDATELKINAMEKCIEKLPHEQRVCIDLFYLQQKCYKEVSDLTGYDMSKVKSYIQNGKRNLKICIQRNGGNN